MILNLTALCHNLKETEYFVFSKSTGINSVNIFDMRSGYKRNEPISYSLAYIVTHNFLENNIQRTKANLSKYILLERTNKLSKIIC